MLANQDYKAYVTGPEMVRPNFDKSLLLLEVYTYSNTLMQCKNLG